MHTVTLTPRQLDELKSALLDQLDGIRSTHKHFTSTKEPDMITTTRITFTVWNTSDNREASEFRADDGHRYDDYSEEYDGVTTLQEAAELFAASMYPDHIGPLTSLVGRARRDGKATMRDYSVVIPDRFEYTPEPAWELNHCL